MACSIGNFRRDLVGGLLPRSAAQIPDWAHLKVRHYKQAAFAMLLVLERPT
jgi:hypothetical protein